MQFKRLRSLPADWIFLGLVLFWVVGFSYPYFFLSLTDNYRQIQTYNLDTALMLQTIQDGLDGGWFYVNRPDYGHLYFNLTMAVAWLYGLGFPLTERAIVFILRLVALAGGCATIAMTFIFARRFLGQGAAIFAAAVMGFSPVLVEFANQAKPDTWQAFFLILSLYWLGRAFEPPPGSARPLRAEFGFVLGASAAAGAAFSSKYQGILLVPFLAFAAVFVPPLAVSDRFMDRATRILVLLSLPLAAALILLARIHHEDILAFLLLTNKVRPNSLLLPAIQLMRVSALVLSPLLLAMTIAYAAGFDLRRLQVPLTRRLAIWLSVALAFVGTFVLTSPWLLAHLQFFGELYQRSDYVTQGEHFGFRWLAMVFGLFGFRTDFLFYTTAILALLGSVFLLSDLGRRDFERGRLALFFLLGFALMFLTLLVTTVNSVISNYALPVVAPLTLLAAYGLKRLQLGLARRPGQGTKAAVALFALVAIGAQIWNGASLLLAYPSLVTALSDENRLLGEWFDRCVPRDARILGAPYSYVPPAFGNFVIGEATGFLNSTKAQIITTHERRIADARKDEARLATKPGYIRSDLARFYDVVLRSRDWVAGPRLGGFQPHMRAGFALRPNCG